MEITATSFSSQTSSAAADTAESKQVSDFDTYLTLLTAQMQNQDPLKPMDSTEFVAQLASFSSVEQQIKTNDQLAELIQLFSGDSQSGLSEWIGNEVRQDGPAAYSGETLKVDVAAEPDADNAIMVVRNEQGQVVNRMRVNSGSASVEWSGILDSGGAAPHGQYNFEIESYKNGRLLKTSQTGVINEVREVRIEATGTVLVFETGGRAPLDSGVSLL